MFQKSQHQFQKVLESADRQRKLSEINAAVRSLKTNVFLLAALALAFLVRFYDENRIYTACISTVAKALTPVLTAMANFGKVKEIFSP
jgi:hypothetical protein